jgi:hypothetical protein
MRSPEGIGDLIILEPCTHLVFFGSFIQIYSRNIRQVLDESKVRLSYCLEMPNVKSDNDVGLEYRLRVAALSFEFSQSKYNLACIADLTPIPSCFRVFVEVTRGSR